MGKSVCRVLMHLIRCKYDQKDLMKRRILRAASLVTDSDSQRLMRTNPLPLTPNPSQGRTLTPCWSRSFQQNSRDESPRGFASRMANIPPPWAKRFAPFMGSSSSRKINLLRSNLAFTCFAVSRSFSKAVTAASWMKGGRP